MYAVLVVLHVMGSLSTGGAKAVLMLSSCLQGLVSIVGVVYELLQVEQLVERVTSSVYARYAWL